MRQSNKQAARRRKLVLASLAAAAGLVPSITRATSRQWIGGSSNWNNSANWSPAQVPGAGDFVLVTSTLGLAQTITYDFPGSVSLSTLTVNLTNGSGGATELLSQSGNTLTTASEAIGSSVAGGGSGTFNQSGGINTVGAVGFFLAVNVGDKGFYNLSGNGQLTCSGAEYIGLNGPAVFNQSGGTHTDNGALELSVGGLATGTYLLSGGVLNANSTESLGINSAGFFNQSGGTNNANASLFFSSGAYTLGPSGVLNVSNGSEAIGAFSATFVQSGGTNNIIGNNSLLLAYTNASSTGSYTLNAGILNAGFSEIIGQVGNGVFTQSGGQNIIANSFMSLGQLAGSTGTYNLSNTGYLYAATSEAVGASGVGIFNQSGGTNIAGSGITIAAQSGSIGTFIISGGSTTTTGPMYVGGNGNPGGTGTLTVSGTGALAVATLTAFNSPGNSINLSGGTITTGSLLLNGNPSLFNWTTGTLNLTTSITFDPIAATNTTAPSFGNALTLGNNQNLNVAGNETLGGTGPFALTLNSGSSHYVSGSLTIPTSGTITQNPGSSLFATQITQTGGTVNGILENQGIFFYQSGAFNGRLLNQGTVNLGPNFIAGNGIENDTSISLSPGQVVTVNGQGLDNLGQFILGGATLSGIGGVLNDFGGTMYANGTINANFANNGILFLQGVLHLNGAPIANNGTITGAGTIFGNFANGAGGDIIVASGNLMAINFPWSNAGVVTLSGGQLGGGAISNTGTLQGNGQINAAVANSSGVIAATGGQLSITGAGSTNGANAQIQAASGSTVLFNQGLATNNGTIALTGGQFNNNNQMITNSATGHISGWGTFDSGGLTNNGNFNIGGNFNVFGPVTNGAGGTIHATGTGLNAFFGPVINGGPIIVNNGASVTFFNTFTGAGTVTNNGSIAFNAISSMPGIGGSGIMSIGATSASTSVQFTPNSGTSTQGALVLNGGSSLDIANNTFKINYGSPANDSVATIFGYLSSGYHGGAWTGTSGIVSSTAAAGNGNPALSVGYADGNTDGGTAAGPNQIVIKYTLAGDANLDGLVNFNDLVAVVQNFNKSGTDWAHGNFTYAASTNFNDLVAVVQNFNKTLTPAASSDVSLGVSTITLGQSAELQSTSVQLPEPHGLAAMGAGAAGLLARRRRALRKNLNPR